MSKLETSGYRRYWPMKQFLGRETLSDGTRVQHEAEVYRDMVTGQVHVPLSSDGAYVGWQGNPENMPTGSKEREGLERDDRSAYRSGWEHIFGGSREDRESIVERLRVAIKKGRESLDRAEAILDDIETFLGDETMPAGGATYNLSDPAPHVPVRGPKEKAIKGTNGGGKTTIKENKGS